MSSDDNIWKNWKLLTCGHLVADPLQTHYCSYIRLDDHVERMVAPGGALGERPFVHPDEHQFLVVHQISELGFTQIIFELRRIMKALDRYSPNYVLATALFKRIKQWIGSIIKTMHVFDTMESSVFLNEFRPVLPPASGAESVNFRRIELLSGIKAGSLYARMGERVSTYKETLDHTHRSGVFSSRWWIEEYDQLNEEDSVADLFRQDLQRRGMVIPAAIRDQKEFHLKNALHAFYRYECAFLQLRDAHNRVAERQIGRDTEGSATLGTPNAPGDRKNHGSGAPYLRAVRDTARFFPELFEAMEELNGKVSPGWHQ